MPVELVAEAKEEEPASMVEAVAEAVTEASGIVKETDEVAAVAHESEKIAEEVEGEAKELETSAFPVVEETTAKSNGTEAASQEEVVTESANTEA